MKDSSKHNFYTWYVYPCATIEKLNGIEMNYFIITYHQLIVAELHKDI